MRSSREIYAKRAAHAALLLLSSVVGIPDLLLLGSADQLLPEVRVGDGDQLLRPLPDAAVPSGQTQPYSVTTYMVLHAGIRDHGAGLQRGTNAGVQRAVLVGMGGGLRQIKLLPPLDRYAPSTKSCWPPAPLICLVPAVSPLTCPYRSTSTALLMEIKLSDGRDGADIVGIADGRGHAAPDCRPDSHTASGYRRRRQIPGGRGRCSCFMHVTLPAMARST